MMEMISLHGTFDDSQNIDLWSDYGQDWKFTEGSDRLNPHTRSDRENGEGGVGAIA